jgi:tRNA(adenine34) deaminase
MFLFEALQRWFRGGSAAAAPTAPGGTPSPHDEPMMRHALELARQAAAIGEVPIGAVVYETASGRVLGTGFNRREIDHDPAAHAELIAIRAACAAIGDWRLNHCTLVVTLEPCPMCAGLIVNARIGRLVYGATDPKAGAAGTLYRLTSDPRLNHRVEPVPGVLADECGAVLKDFFRQIRARRGT